MTCKDCIHYDICTHLCRGLDMEDDNTLASEHCLDFKDKSKFVDLQSQMFTHICKSDRDLYPTEFSIYARIISENDNIITIDRFQKFGAIYCGRLTFEKKDFEKYYKPIE